MCGAFTHHPFAKRLSFPARHSDGEQIVDGAIRAGDGRTVMHQPLDHATHLSCRCGGDIHQSRFTRALGSHNLEAGPDSIVNRRNALELGLPEAESKMGKRLSRSLAAGFLVAGILVGTVVLALSETTSKDPCPQIVICSCSACSAVIVRCIGRPGSATLFGFAQPRHPLTCATGREIRL